MIQKIDNGKNRTGGVKGYETIGLIGLALLGFYVLLKPSVVLWKVFFIQKERFILLVPAFIYIYIRFFTVGTGWDRKVKWSRGMVMAIILFILMGVSVYIQDKQASSGLAEREAIGFIFGIVRNGVIWFLVGASLCYAPFKFNKYIVAGGITFLFVSLAKNVGYDMTIDYNNLIDLSDTGEAISHYDVGEYVLFFLFYCYAVIPKAYKMPLCLIGVAMLYMCGGRSALFIGSFSVFIYELFVRKSFKLSASMIFSSVGIALGLAGMYFVMGQAGLTGGKMFLEGGLMESGSFQGRIVALNIGLERLGEQFIYGGVTDIVKQFGMHGAYIHNGLSAWQFFGFPIFTLILCLLVTAIRTMLQAHRGSVGYNSLTMFGLMLTFAVLSLCINRHVGTFYLWVSLGYWFSYSCLISSKK